MRHERPIVIIRRLFAHKECEFSYRLACGLEFAETLIGKGICVSTKGSHDPSWAVIREILEYLLNHPDAIDTMEGIMKWWLSEHVASTGRENVKEALDALVSTGWVTERSSTLPTLYGLRKDRQSEIRRFLEQCGQMNEED